MQLKTFRHLCGITPPFKDVFPATRKAGYDGVEFRVINAVQNYSFKQLLKDYDFEFITQIHTTGETVAEHVASFKDLIQRSLPLNPILINSQSGRDNWGVDEKNDFILQALNYEKEIGIPVAHEIHRGRITYSPWETCDLLLSFKELKICCDLSHWVCVCERLLQTETEIIKLCASRCIHIHSRVGYEQGLQVPDPRAPEYAKHLQAHEHWWDIIWQKQWEKGCRQTTMTPEFRPLAHHHTSTFTNMPVSNVLDICNWMNNRQKERFETLNYQEHVTAKRTYSK